MKRTYYTYIPKSYVKLWGIKQLIKEWVPTIVFTNNSKEDESALYECDKKELVRYKLTIEMEKVG
jgi:hypothetical protein